ncbi:Proteasome subunit beta type-7 [Entomophthora muscae]|uniref:Proteasome subunit beta type-7 n=1 Tax=Entomophthora muscae TaxID=34485 RepID=A0ACC2TS27_9FUNG|nr:Proteasome subunit beta type-7 [Entomophthora muscae]
MEANYSFNEYMTAIKPSYYAEPVATHDQGPTTHTQQPIVTGTSVIGIKYKDGVMLAADCLASYGSLARFKDVRRLHKVAPTTILGAGGDMSDFQSVQHMLRQLMVSESNHDDGHTLGTANIYEYMCRLMYSRRTKMNPLWNSFVIGGVDNGEGFLGFVDLRGTHYTSPTIATGFGAYLAQPILRKATEERDDLLSEEEARKVIDDCLRVLFYRDARSMNKMQIAKITAEGAEISEPFSLETEWGFAEQVRGYGA